jgi:hypothetical protein
MRDRHPSFISITSLGNFLTDKRGSINLSIFKPLFEVRKVTSMPRRSFFTRFGTDCIIDSRTIFVDWKVGTAKLPLRPTLSCRVLNVSRRCQRLLTTSKEKCKSHKSLFSGLCFSSLDFLDNCVFVSIHSILSLLKVSKNERNCHMSFFL